MFKRTQITPIKPLNIMTNNPWSGLTPENNKIWEQLEDEYVPKTGKAETIGGEILRAMDRIIYRFYNDGDMVGVNYGNTTCNGSDRYLCNVVPGYVTLDQFYEGQEKEYENQMLKDHRLVFTYLMNNKEVFEQPNTVDSREISEEDIRREHQSFDD